MQTTLFAITDRNAVMQGNRGRIEESCDSWDFPFGVNKEVVGIHVLLTRLLFACDILRRLLLHVSLVKPTSALLRFLWRRRMKLQFASRQNQEPPKTHQEPGAVRHT